MRFLALRRLPRAWLAGAIALAASGVFAQSVPTLPLSQLPGPLRDVWNRTKPEMNEASRCAAAFDAGDPEKMVLRCSVYMRVGGEAERRALRYCEEKRAELRIRGACAIVVE
jgi:hypothetical protein